MGHVVRKDGFEVLALTGKIKGKRSRGRKRMLWLTSQKDGQEVLALTGKIEGKRSRGRKRMFWLTSLNEWIREREGSNIRQWS